MKVFILLCTLTVTFAFKVVCPKNQHYDSCGSGCAFTCENYTDHHKYCAKQCVPGCGCKKGYVKAEGGHCIKPEDCPHHIEHWCGENERYEHCGPNCPDTCENYKDVRKPCLRRCVKGCFCNEGFVKAEDGNCVKPENCVSSIKTLCHKNEHYEYCGTGCPSTCENQQITHKSCSERCVAGCFCNKGYVKAEDGRCIKNEHCAFQDPKCPKNQHFEICGIPCLFTCETHFPPEPCIKTCISGCYCDEGYRKTPKGDCVKPGRCPPRIVNCPENQHFKACGTPCLYTCEKFLNRRKRCLERCVPDCFCNIGFLKTEDGRCVRRENCPVRKLIDCPENEHFEECGSAYPTTCDNSQDFEPPEVEMCVEGCFCNKGFLRDENGQCVTPENCPRVCEQQKLSGPCTLRIQRFYFNNETRQCEIFIYGGCLGNRNNFMTKQQCEATCVECPEKQHFEVCSSPCESSCEKYRDYRKVCLENCVSGCFCDKGYLKTKDGRCVEPENCPIRMLMFPKKQNFNICGSPCASSCEKYRDQTKVCLEPEPCVSGCFCDEGYLKTKDGRCVKPENCPLRMLS